MAAQKKIKSYPDVVECFKEFPFSNKFIEKSRLKCLKTLICFLCFLFMKN